MFGIRGMRFDTDGYITAIALDASEEITSSGQARDLAEYLLEMAKHRLPSDPTYKRSFGKERHKECRRQA
jgi:hypothetical protein